MANRKCMCCNFEYDYCPNCGNPLNEKAIELEKNKTLNIRLETLLKLTENIEDERTLRLIKDLISKIK